MVYKNLIIRTIISVLILVIYLILSLNNFNLIYYLIIFFYLLILLEVFLYFSKFKYLPIIYILTSFIFFLNLKFESINYYIFNLFILTIIAFDIFSYFVGSYLGKTKILPYISPKKTLEGLLGGIIFSILTSYIFLKVIDYEFSLNIIIFLILLIMCSFLGDIIESYFKRKNKLKNSSNFLPGHGGFFDRFDSFIFAIFPYYIFTTNIL